MPNFSSVALFVQKLFRWGNFTPPQLFNVHKKSPTGKGIISKINFLKLCEKYPKLLNSSIGLGFFKKPLQRLKSHL